MFLFISIIINVDLLTLLFDFVQHMGRFFCKEARADGGSWKPENVYRLHVTDHCENILRKLDVYFHSLQYVRDGLVTEISAKINNVLRARRRNTDVNFSE